MSLRIGPLFSFRTACCWSLSLSLLTLSHCGGRCCSSASRAHPRRGYWVVACAISHPTRRELTPNACMSIAVLDTTLFNPLGRRDRRPFPKPRGGFCCFGVSAFAGSLGIASERVVYSTCHVPACTLVRSWSRHQICKQSSCNVWNIRNQSATGSTGTRVPTRGLAATLTQGSPPCPGGALAALQTFLS